MGRVYVSIVFLFIITFGKGTFLIAQEANLSQGNVFDGEPFLLMNPNDSKHLIVAWMSWINFENQFQIKTKISFDGGETWEAELAHPHLENNYTSADPCLDFGPNGEVYLCYIDFTGTTPPCKGAIAIQKSNDGGLSWGELDDVITTGYDNDQWPIDRPWIKVDRSASDNRGKVYVTTFNLNRNSPPYNPYLSVSSNGGKAFFHRKLDTVNWLAGNLNPLPMCSPSISKEGTFYGAFPSYEPNQSLFFRNLLAYSENGGVNVSHKLIQNSIFPAKPEDFPHAKKAPILLCDPDNDMHLVYVFPSVPHGDIDIYMIESFDAGDNWSSPIRINDDEVANDNLQDMIWGSFSSTGDLFISWRDRRNALGDSYKEPSEIWGAYRSADSIGFSKNFKISSELVAYDSVLERSGNDFMCSVVENDTIYATWGDTRNGKLNIWFQKLTNQGEVLSIKSISSSDLSQILLFPNPTTDLVSISAKQLKLVKIYSSSGELIESHNYDFIDNVTLDFSLFSFGTYYIEIETLNEIVSRKLILK